VRDAEPQAQVPALHAVLQAAQRVQAARAQPARSNVCSATQNGLDAGLW
jgi:hypothetical protein